MIYCINLEERTDKKALCEKVFNKYGLDVEFFPAVDGRDWEKNEHDLLPGYQGLNQTLVNLLTKAIELDLEYVTIFEDDIEFNSDPKGIVEDLPEGWDMFYYGCLNSYRAPKIVGNIHKVRRAFLGHAMVLKNTMFKPVIDELKKMDRPSDLCIADVYRDLDNFKAYCSIPGVAYQRAGFSDNLKSKVKAREVD